MKHLQDTHNATQIEWYHKKNKTNKTNMQKHTQQIIQTKNAIILIKSTKNKQHTIHKHTHKTNTNKQCTKLYIYR